MFFFATTSNNQQRATANNVIPFHSRQPDELSPQASLASFFPPE